MQNNALIYGEQPENPHYLRCSQCGSLALEVSGVKTRRAATTDERPLDRLVRRQRWIKQTTFYQPDAKNPNKGNCTEAAVASLLGIPLPPKFGPSGDVYEFWTDMDACFEAHGFWAMRKDGDYQPDGLYLASGPSARGCSHMVVMRAGKLVHDPHPSDAGLLKVEHVWLAVPIDPAMPPNT